MHELRKANRSKSSLELPTLSSQRHEGRRTALVGQDVPCRTLCFLSPLTSGELDS